MLLLAAATAAAGCVNGTSEPTTGLFYTIKSSIADSTQFPAGSIVVVRATVTHDGTPLLAAPVGWGVKGGGGIVHPLTSLTDSLGVTSVQWVLGDTAGVNTLIMVSGDASDTLTVLGVVGTPINIVAVGFDSTTAAVGAPVTVQARVTDRVGNNAANATVNWTTSGGSISASTVPTTSDGISQVTFTAATPGSYFVTAELPGQATHTYQIVVQ